MSPLLILGQTSIQTAVILLGLFYPTLGRTADEVSIVPTQHPAEHECVCRIGKHDSVHALRRLLSAAIRARGGLEVLESQKDDYSVTSIVHHDVYTTKFLYRTWTMKPNRIRQDTVRDGVILKSQQYDGKTFIKGYRHHVRYGLEKDLNVLLENMELNRIFSLLCINTEPYPATPGERTRQDGRWLQEVRVQAPSGLTYRVFFDQETCLIAKLEYVEREQYAESEEFYSIVTYIDSYRTVDGLRVADRLRIFSQGVLKAEVRLLEYKFNLGLSAGFFSIDRLRQDLAANPLKSEKTGTAGALEQGWRESVYHKIVERLQTHGDCRFREVASYGDPERYHQRLFGSGLSLVVDPKYLEDDDVLAFYAELLAGPSGFYEDCIVLASPPQSASVSAELLLHETTHAVLRRGQEKAPLRIADDEYLAYYQDGLFAVGSLLESFERIAFATKRSKEPRISEEAARVWRAARRNLQQNLKHNGMTQQALEQFREWCGVDFDLNRIRRHYLDLGVAPNWMPMDSTTGSEDVTQGIPR